jgi:hypothetical protein
MWQQTPGTATTQEVEDGVQDFPLGILFWSAAWFGRGNQMLNQRPFTVTEISGVWFPGFHAPM